MHPTCPTCHAAPPPLVPCDACEEEHAPFTTAGACPRCALVWDALTCPACERRALLEAWVPEGAERRAFLARLLGGDAPPDDPQVGPWTAAWRKAARAVTTEVTELFAPVDETTDPTPLRAAILDAEDALEAARRGERELAAIATDANAAALAIEVEAARKATRAAVESAQRALDGARKDAEELHRRLLDRKRTPPVEPDAPAEIVPNPAPDAQCPSCAWRPDGYPRWECNRCDRALDAFATHARCPGCARRFVQTRCPHCQAWAPLAEWFRASGGAPVELGDEAHAPAAASSTLKRLASQVASSFDRNDPRQEKVAGSLERAAVATDRAVDQVTGWVASLQDDGVGAARYQTQDWQGVVDECTRTLRAEPEHPMALTARADARLKLGDDAGARRDVDAALSLTTLAVDERAFALTTRARIKEGMCDLIGAVDDCTAALELDPALSTARLQRATARFHLGLLDEAKADLDEALRVTSIEAAPGVQALRAAVHVMRNDGAAAEADATDALARDSLRADWLYSLRATGRAHSGRREDAIADIRCALRLAPANGNGYGLRAQVRANADDVNGALRDLARLRRQDPWGERSGHRFALAIEASLRGERERMLILLRRERALAAQPEYAALWLTLFARVDDALPPAHAGWSGDLVRFVRGDLTLDALVLRAAQPGRAGSTPEERRCEAHGYAGLLAERDGRADEARRCYEVAAGAVPCVEALWASLRLSGRVPRATPVAAPPTPPVPASAVSLADQLERLARLREQGVLTPEEFALAKRRILDA